jgi:hypothetical protein
VQAATCFSGTGNATKLTPSEILSAVSGGSRLTRAEGLAPKQPSGEARAEGAD